MRTRLATLPNTTPAWALLVMLPCLAGCGVNVTDRDTAGGKSVEISSPVGNLSVQTNVETPDTGLPAFPGARPLEDDHGSGSADVRLDSPVVGLTVAAAKYEGAARPDEVLAFYRDAMRRYGAVSECRGNLDFEGARGARRPVCRARAAPDVQLMVGPEEDMRLVSVKPRGDGSEVAVVHVSARERH